jgi:hypothetical protein
MPDVIIKKNNIKPAFAGFFYLEFLLFLGTTKSVAMKKPFGILLLQTLGVIFYIY